MRYRDGFFTYLKVAMAVNIAMTILFFSFMRSLLFPSIGSLPFIILNLTSAIFGLLNLSLLIWGIISASTSQEKLGWALPLLSSLLTSLFLQPRGSGPEEVLPVLARNSVLWFAIAGVYLIVYGGHVSTGQWKKFVLVFISLVLTDPNVLWTISNELKVGMDETTYLIFNDLNVLLKIALFAYLFLHAEMLRQKNIEISRFPSPSFPAEI